MQTKQDVLSSRSLTSTFFFFLFSFVTFPHVLHLTDPFVVDCYTIFSVVLIGEYLSKCVSEKGLKNFRLDAKTLARAVV